MCAIEVFLICIKISENGKNQGKKTFLLNIVQYPELSPGVKRKLSSNSFQSRAEATYVA